MPSIFLVIFKLTQTWILVTIAFNSSANIRTLIANIEHGLYHAQPGNLKSESEESEECGREHTEKDFQQSKTPVFQISSAGVVWQPVWAGLC